jgi:hypothetical protein
VPLKELLIFGCWLRGLSTDRIDWRGNRLRVRAASRLEPVPAPERAPEPARARA